MNINQQLKALKTIFPEGFEVVLSSQGKNETRIKHIRPGVFDDDVEEFSDNLLDKLETGIEDHNINNYIG